MAPYSVLRKRSMPVGDANLKVSGSYARSQVGAQESSQVGALEREMKMKIVL